MASRAVASPPGRFETSWLAGGSFKCNSMGRNKAISWRSTGSVINRRSTGKVVRSHRSALDSLSFIFSHQSCIGGLSRSWILLPCVSSDRVQLPKDLKRQINKNFLALQRQVGPNTCSFDWRVSCSITGLFWSPCSPFGYRKFLP